MNYLHNKAKTSLKGEVLTTELLNETNSRGETVWHLAARYNTLKDIPQHLFSDAVAGIRDMWNSSLFHAAAVHGSLNAIPEHLFTDEVLNQKDYYGNTIWHIVAKHDTLNVIPEHLFTEKALSKKNNFGETPWEYIAKNKTISQIPQHLINKSLLKMKNEDNDLLFTGDDVFYINNVITERLNNSFTDFIANNPSLERAIEFADPRLKLIEASNNALIFKFDGINTKLTLNKDGAFIKKVNHSTLCKAVSFIEKTYPNIEQSLVLPSSHNTNIGDLSL